PTESSSVTLLWHTVPGAVSYKVYRGDLYIYDVEGMTELASTGNSFYMDSLIGEGVFYYVVVAENRFGLSYISNCVFIHYIPPSLREFAITTSVLSSLAITAVVFIRSRKKKD
ncbi:MAG: hypothetical protein ACW96U_12205, partial [Candidatus Heimdallarchaeaceae archaeon]